MKRVLIVVALVVIAAVAGIVRSHTRVSRSGLGFSVSSSAQPGSEVRDEIRKSYELSPGAEVEVKGINGAVTIETSDSKTAEVFIVRTAKDQDALNNRKIVIDSTATSLTIRSEKGDVGFLDHLFGSNPSEKVTLKLPRQIHLAARGVNGSVTVGELDGSLTVSGVNGRVEVAQATGSAEFHGINGNISVALKQLQREGVRLSGINGNIELRIAEGVNADLETHGMNGNVRSDVSDIVVSKSEHGNRYSAQIGTGGNPITVSGVNGNVRLTRAATASTTGNTEATKLKSPAVDSKLQ
jgi:DUF4097 and DUF4098 domain-containing protein YvlB